jgi:putative protease
MGICTERRIFAATKCNFMHKIELLSPARDAEIGIEAFRHGADAVYIGAPRFGARAAAGCSVADIERMARFGHQFGARTFVAMNTILTDSELRDAETLAHQLYEAGVDALIVQDYGLLTLHLPPIELHASTQMDTRTPDKARLLRDLGMTRVVLARELSVEQIRTIHEAVGDTVELECFVHGALCVSVSGQCYLSQALTGRSANRGECAQPCRLPMELVDGRGQTLVRDKHLLSLKDMNRSGELEALIAAGVTSLKIEGRLKDMTYVKNVTAYYRRRLDALLEGHPEWKAASDGHCTYTFEPRPAASFNRGFTNYYAEGHRDTEAGRRELIWSPDTPKSIGERIGQVGQVGRDWLTCRADDAAQAPLTLANGDGLVAQTADGTIRGFRLNRYDPTTQRLYPAGGGEVCAQLRPGMALYRNADAQLDRLLSKPSADRRIALDVDLWVSPGGLTLRLTDETGAGVTQECAGPFEPARTPQQENYRRQLTKFGDTYYILRAWKYHPAQPDAPDYFIPSSLLADLRRQAVAGLDESRQLYREAARRGFESPDYQALADRVDARGILPTDYRANVMNHSAADLMRRMKVADVAPAYELQPAGQGPVMFTQHCLKFALGYCPKYQHADARPPEPWSLKIGGRNFVIKFGCKNDCMSEIIPTFATQNK